MSLFNQQLTVICAEIVPSLVHETLTSVLVKTILRLTVRPVLLLTEHLLHLQVFTQDIHLHVLLFQQFEKSTSSFQVLNHSKSLHSAALLPWSSLLSFHQLTRSLSPCLLVFLENLLDEMLVVSKENASRPVAHIEVTVFVSHELGPATPVARESHTHFFLTN